MSHVVLLGDSIFDNQRYVAPGPSVAEQLRSRLATGWSSTLLAWDGAVVTDVHQQLTNVPEGASHLIVSVGGNDALDQSSLILHDDRGLIHHLATVHAAFQEKYRSMLQSVLKLGRPTAVCTIYDSIPGMDRREKTGLCLFNDVILREAFRLSVPVVELRLVCNEREDYAQSSPIEPSVAGGAKIVRAICRVVETHDFAATGTRVFA